MPFTSAFMSVLAGRPVFIRFFLGIFGLLVVIYVLALSTITILQDRMLFLPDPIHQAPSEFGLKNFSEEKITTEDAETLMVWRAKAKPGRQTLIFFHGNAGGLRHQNELFRSLAQQGYGLIAVEWRGYGASTGQPSEQGFMKDARATYHYAMADGVDPKHLFVVGQSLGSGVALWLASQFPVAGVIVDSPYSSIVDVAAARYWMFPVNLLARNRFPAHEWIQRVNAPILGLTGENDATMPLPFAQSLFKVANPGNSKLMVFPGAGHLTLYRSDAFNAAVNFINSKHL